MAACLVAATAIAQGDLEIGIEELESEDQLLRMLDEHYGDDVPIEISPDLRRILDAVEAGDDDALRAVLSDIAGEEVLLKGELPDFSTPHQVRERRSTDDILAGMRPEHVEALADHQHLLDDHRRLFREVDRMDGVERAAAMEFIAGMSKRPESVESMMPPEMLEELRVSRERGWFDLPGPAVGSSLLREVELLGSDGQARLRRTSLELGPDDDGIAEPAVGYSFDSLAHERLEVFPDSEFGAVLHIEKSVAADFHPHDPNLFIAGHDASVTVGKHTNDVWVTTVSAFDGRHLYEIVLERRLEGAERDAFVRMATELIEDDRASR